MAIKYTTEGTTKKKKKKALPLPVSTTVTPSTGSGFGGFDTGGSSVKPKSIHAGQNIPTELTLNQQQLLASKGLTIPGSTAALINQKQPGIPQGPQGTSSLQSSTASNTGGSQYLDLPGSTVKPSKINKVKSSSDKGGTLLGATGISQVETPVSPPAAAIV